MGKTLTQAVRLRARMAAAMHEVCEWLEMTDEEYSQHMYKMGLQYLKLTLSETDALLVMATRQYWGWWRVQWYLREQLFLSDAHAVYLPVYEVQRNGRIQLVLPNSENYKAWVPSPMLTVNGRRIAWNELHDARMLAQDPAMDASYATINWNVL